MMNLSRICLLITLFLSIESLSTQLFADSQTVIVNNAPPANTASNSNANSSNCNNQTNNSQPQPPPGTYYQTNPHGGMDTVYSTGNKQPYIVDNNCNGNATIQPYVYAQPPGPPGPPGR